MDEHPQVPDGCIDVTKGFTAWSAEEFSHQSCCLW
jgi:hypothetical protein